MRIQKMLALVGVSAVLSLAGVSLAAPAVAVVGDTTVLGAVSAASPETLSNTASVATTTTGDFAINATVAGTNVKIPTSSDRDITFGANGKSIAIRIPEGNDASRAEFAKQGVIAFDSADGSVTVPAVIADGSLQISTVIPNAKSPHAYTYAITADGDYSVDVSDDGTTASVVSDGILLAAINPAWAKDSRGHEVPTHYSTDGKSLTQTVDISSREIAFPVVADPQFVWYLGFVPSLKLNKAETLLAAANMTMATKQCLQLGRFAATVGVGLCAVSAAQIVLKSSMNVAQGKCTHLILQGPLLLASEHKDSYCK